MSSRVSHDVESAAAAPSTPAPVVAASNCCATSSGSATDVPAAAALPVASTPAAASSPAGLRHRRHADSPTPAQSGLSRAAYMYQTLSSLSDPPAASAGNMNISGWLFGSSGGGSGAAPSSARKEGEGGRRRVDSAPERFSYKDSAAIGAPVGVSLREALQSRRRGAARGDDTRPLPVFSLHVTVLAARGLPVKESVRVHCFHPLTSVTPLL